MKSFQSFREEFFRASVLRKSALVSISKAFSSLMNLVFMVYAVNLLTKTENGYLQYFMGFVPILLAVAEFGLPSALVKFLSPHTENPSKIGAILASSLLIKLYTIVMLGGLGMVFFYQSKEDSFILFLLVSGSIIASFASYFESILVSFRNYGMMSLWTPLPNFIRLSLLFLISNFSAFSLSYLEILTIYSISPLFVFVSFFWISNRLQLNWTASWQDIITESKNLSMFNLWVLVASIFAMVSDRLEIFFLNRYHSPDVVAEYGTALQLFSGFVIIFSTLNSLIYPKLSRLADTPEFKPYLLKSISIGMMMALALSPGFFLAEWILEILFGGKYTNSIPVFQILYPNYLLQLVFAPMGMALFALGQPKVLAILALLRLLFGLYFDSTLIPDGGSTSAALAMFLGQIASWLILSGYFLALFRGNSFQVRS